MKKLAVTLFLLLTLCFSLKGQETKEHYLVYGGDFMLIKDGKDHPYEKQPLFPHDTLRLPPGNRGLCLRRVVNGEKEKKNTRITEGYEGDFCLKDLLNGSVKKTKREAAYKAAEEEYSNYTNAICSHYLSGYVGSFVQQDSILVSRGDNSVIIQNLSGQSFYLDIVCVIDGKLMSAISQDKEYSSDYYFWPDTVDEIDISEYLAQEKLYLLVSDVSLPTNGIVLSDGIARDNLAENLSLLPVKKK